jgi:hypothetical protein
MFFVRMRYEGNENKLALGATPLALGAYELGRRAKRVYVSLRLLLNEYRIFPAPDGRKNFTLYASEFLDFAKFFKLVYLTTMVIVKEYFMAAVKTLTAHSLESYKFHCNFLIKF